MPNQRTRGTQGTACCLDSVPFQNVLENPKATEAKIQCVSSDLNSSQLKVPRSNRKRGFLLLGREAPSFAPIGQQVQNLAVVTARQRSTNWLNPDGRLTHPRTNANPSRSPFQLMDSAIATLPPHPPTHQVHLGHSCRLGEESREAVYVSGGTLGCQLLSISAANSASRNAQHARLQFPETPYVTTCWLTVIAIAMPQVT